MSNDSLSLGNTADSIAITNQQPASFSFNTGNGPDGLLFTIKADGEIVKGPAFTTDDAASLRFWEMIAGAFPSFIRGISNP